MSPSQQSRVDSNASRGTLAAHPTRWLGPWSIVVALLLFVALDDARVLRVFPPGDLLPRLVAAAVLVAWFWLGSRGGGRRVADAAGHRPTPPGARHPSWESPHAHTIAMLAALVCLLLRGVDADADAPFSLTAAFVAFACFGVHAEARAVAAGGGAGPRPAVLLAVAFAAAVLAVAPAFDLAGTAWGTPLVAADLALVLAVAAVAAAGPPWRAVGRAGVPAGAGAAGEVGAG